MSMQVYDNDHPSGMRFCILANESEWLALRLMAEHTVSDLEEMKEVDGTDRQILALMNQIKRKLDNPVQRRKERDKP